MTSKCTKCKKELGGFIFGKWKYSKGKKYCLDCSETKEEKKPFKEERKSLTQSGWFWLAVIFTIIFIVGFISEYNPDVSQPTVEETIADPTPTYSVNTVQLIGEYKRNQIAADAKYKDQYISVSGFIAKIGDEAWVGPYVMMQESDYSFNVVQCGFEHSSDLLNLATGEYVTMEGYVIGISGNNVLLDDCKISS